MEQIMNYEYYDVCIYQPSISRADCVQRVLKLKKLEVSRKFRVHVTETKLVEWHFLLNSSKLALCTSVDCL